MMALTQQVRNCPEAHALLRLESPYRRLEKGTTYNSYIIYGDKTALVDASHEKFRGLYMDTLKKELKSKGRKLDYVVVSHTEPDHSGEPALPLAAWDAEPRKPFHNPLIKAWLGPHCDLQDGRLRISWAKSVSVIKGGDKQDIGMTKMCM